MEHDNHITSHRSGVACHLNKETAALKSYYELIERDSFLMHYLHPELKSDVLYRSSNDLYVVTTNKLQTIDDSTVVLMSSIYDKQSHVFYIGLSAGSDNSSTQELIDHSLLEATMLTKNWTIPKFSTIEKNSTTNILSEHLLSSKIEKNRKAIEQIIDGGQKTTLEFKINKKCFEVEHELKLNNRYIIKGCIPDILKLNFGKRWQESSDECQFLMNKRGLSVTHWGVHPLM